MTNVAYTTLTKVGRMASHGVTLGVIKWVKNGVKLKLIVSLHLVICMFSETNHKLCYFKSILAMALISNSIPKKVKS